ncbi:uncharacterized protein [Ambystoma mexicanum]|uniref:uncharacterized protein n=1 Tax=Ambystoma mexicanum TaxID=8296 RepID=UPI0037E7CBCA
MERSLQRDISPLHNTPRSSPPRSRLYKRAHSPEPPCRSRNRTLSASLPRVSPPRSSPRPKSPIRDPTVVPSTASVSDWQEDPFRDFSDPEEGEITHEPDTQSEWDDYLIEKPRKKDSPGDTSPPNNPVSFHTIISKVADVFILQVTLEEKKSVLYEHRDKRKRTITTIPLLDTIWDTGAKILATPLSTPALVSRREKKYKAPDTAPLCLRGHTNPNSVITGAARKRLANSLSPLSAPPDKEGRKLEAMGRKVSSSSTLTIRAGNSPCHELAKRLPTELQEETRVIISDGEATFDHMIDAAMDIAESGFGQMARGTVLRRQAWMKATNLRPEVQAQILDMPFDAQDLFGKKIDNHLKGIKADTDAARAISSLKDKDKDIRSFPSFRGAPSKYWGFNWPSSSQKAQGNTFQRQLPSVNK